MTASAAVGRVCVVAIQVSRAGRFTPDDVSICVKDFHSLIGAGRVQIEPTFGFGTTDSVGDSHR